MKKKIFLLGLLVIIGLFLESVSWPDPAIAFWPAVPLNSPDNPTAIPGVNIGVCVHPPFPNVSDAAKPIFSWTTSGNPQTQYWLLVDDSPPEIIGGKVRLPSPVIDTGAVSSVNKFHQLSQNQLNRNQTYYWCVAVRDAHGWTGWTGCDSLVTTNNKPLAFDLSSRDNSCGVVKPRKDLFWKFSDPDTGDFQTAFQIQIARDPGFGNIVLDTNKIVSGLSSYTTAESVLDYSATYFWRVRLWDNFDKVSAWTNDSFITPKHQFPTPDYLCDNKDCAKLASPVVLNQVVILTDNSIAYGGSKIVKWKWSLPLGVALIKGDLSDREIWVRFEQAGISTITLKATDSKGYTCPVSKTFSVGKKIPWWKEILPRF